MWFARTSKRNRKCIVNVVQQQFCAERDDVSSVSIARTNMHQQVTRVFVTALADAGPYPFGV